MRTGRRGSEKYRHTIQPKGSKNFRPKNIRDIKTCQCSSPVGNIERQEQFFLQERVLHGRVHSGLLQCFGQQKPSREQVFLQQSVLHGSVSQSRRGASASNTWIWILLFDALLCGDFSLTVTNLCKREEERKFVCENLRPLKMSDVRQLQCSGVLLLIPNIN